MYFLSMYFYVSIYFQTFHQIMTQLEDKLIMDSTEDIPVVTIIHTRVY